MQDTKCFSHKIIRHYIGDQYLLNYNRHKNDNVTLYRVNIFLLNNIAAFVPKKKDRPLNIAE